MNNNDQRKTFDKKSFWTKRGGRGSKPYSRGRGSYRGNFKKSYTSKTSSPTTFSQPIRNEVPNTVTQLSGDNSNQLVSFSPQSGIYKGWKYYFPNERYTENCNITKKLKIVEKYLGEIKETLKLDDIEEQGSFTVDLNTVLSSKTFPEDWPSFLEDFKNTPDEIINYFGLAMHQILSDNVQKEIFSNIQSGQNSNSSQLQYPDISIPIIHSRFINYEPVTPLRDIKANSYGKYLAVRGTVVRVSNIKPLCTKMAFECFSCKNVQVILQPYGRYTLPTKCTAQRCRCHTFMPLRDSPLTETVNCQTIRLQETTADDQRDGGRVPRTVECELTYDLVDNCVPGDIVTISGVVKVNSSNDNRFRIGKDKCMFLLYILGNSVVSLKSLSSASDRKCITSDGLEFSLKDLYAVQAIHAEENLFRLFTASICPSIYGHEMVKAGLVLGLIGGTQKYLDDNNYIPVRGDPHVLVVGDPGLGKSQMLQFCANISPRGVYVCGNTTTTTGLTVTLTKEGGAGEYALEAGALILADQGCCCIDEFDKMSTQHQALLEAMEQQTISIAKGGMVCTLPARTSILAAANPVGGHYNKAKTVSENLKLSSALLSRFDLVFILLDKPDEVSNLCAPEFNQGHHGIHLQCTPDMQHFY